ncbi:nucleoside hydrolase [Cytophagaceae bacterium DM2B3-1]|uniref:Nucleoside hydrolase n=1 Tax=Xanthocytophaga flava TaxID=3048013 RepID=A0ABT7CP85_9BACT|nr:nucleoside hydrolase [Xanthocytophaga flavus]MDJ1466316.1 nucleoside hydrolase [Xanthocytophaga flavus]MDJ1495521.1 nucleoside hydrolase [Xanthocytophaga flavus]
MKRRTFTQLLTFLIAGTTATSWSRSLADKKLTVIIDADTANEIDDLYAIVRALLEPRFQIKGLCSAQWHNQLSPANTVQESQKLNEDLLRLMSRIDIPAPLGSEMIMGQPWGEYEGRNSPATQLMIHTARQMPAGEKLIIISLGAATNVASALKLAPDIMSKVICYNLGGHYDATKKIWNKDEFNVRNDLNAINFLFNTEGVDLHLMPINILYDFKFTLEEISKRLSGKGGIWDYLVTRWLSNAPGDKERIFWDLALMIAVARPDLAREEKRLTPPENTQREVFVYTQIDVKGMINDWWKITGK